MKTFFFKLWIAVTFLPSMFLCGSVISSKLVRLWGTRTLGICGGLLVRKISKNQKIKVNLDFSGFHCSLVLEIYMATLCRVRHFLVNFYSAFPIIVTIFCQILSFSVLFDRNWQTILKIEKNGQNLSKVLPITTKKKRWAQL